MSILLACGVALLLILLFLTCFAIVSPSSDRNAPAWISGGDIVLLLPRGRLPARFPEPSDPFPAVVILSFQRGRSLDDAAIRAMLAYSRKLDWSGKQLFLVGVDETLYARIQKEKDGVWKTGPWVFGTTEEAWESALRWLRSRSPTSRSPRGSGSRAGDRRDIWRRGA